MKTPNMEQFQRLIPPSESSATDLEFMFNDRRVKLHMRNWGGSFSISFSIPSGNDWKIGRLLTGIESPTDLCKIWESFLEHPHDYLDPNWYKKLQYQP